MQVEYARKNVTERSEQRSSDLRMARLAKNWTIERLLSEIAARLPDGNAAVTVSQVSAWELGRVQTSLRYREILCDIYSKPADVLFSHQDGATRVQASEVEAPQILRPQGPTLISAMHEIVEQAEEFLVVTGSRSRSITYLEAIERTLRDRPNLVHYRILYGMPHHRVLPEHLLKLVQMRDVESTNRKTLHIGIVRNTVMMVERFLCVSEKGAVIVIPSLVSSENFDSGIRLGKSEAVEFLNHGREAYAGSFPIETSEAIRSLEVLF